MLQRCVQSPNTFVFCRPVFVFYSVYYARCPSCRGIGAVSFDDETQRKSAYLKIVNKDWVCINCERDADKAERDFHASHI